MNEYYLKIEADIDKVIRLREEITRLEAELKKIDVNQEPKMVQSIQKQMSAISAEMQKTIEEISKMGTAVISQVQKIAYAIDINNLSVEDSIQILKAYAEEQTKYLDEIKNSTKELEKASTGASAGDFSGIEADLEAIRAKLEEKKITIKEVKADLAGFETTYNTLCQKADEYGSRIQSLTVEKERLIQSGQMGSDEYAQVIEELGKVQLAYNAVQKEQEALTAYGRGQIAGLASGISGLANVLTVAQGAMSLFGASSQKLAEIQGKLQTAITITNAIQQVYGTLSATSAFRTQTVTAITRGLSAAQIWLATTLGISAVAAKALMAALTLGLSVAITGIVLLIDRYISKQREEKAAQEEAIAAAKRRAEEERNIQHSMASSVASQVTDYKRLQLAYNELGDDMNKKKKFIQDNQAEFDKLGISVNSLLDAENLFVNNEQAFIQSLTNRAIAAAAMKMAEEDYTKAIQKMMDAENYVVGVKEQSKAKEVADNWVSDNIKPDSQTFRVITTSFGKNNRDPKIQGYRGLHQNQYNTELEAQKQASVEAIQKEAELIKQGGDMKVKIATGMMTKSNKDLENAGLTPKNKNNTHNFDRAALEKQEIDRIRAYEDLENEVEKARIATLTDGEEKVLATIALNNKREIEAIKRKKEDAIRAEKETFEKDPTNANKTYDPAKTAKKYDEMIGFVQTKQLIDEDDRLYDKEKDEQEKRDQILDKYQTYYDKLTAIQEKYQTDRKALEDAGGSQEQQDELNSQEQDEINALNEEIAMREDAFIAWADSIATAGLDQLNGMLTKAKDELEKLKNENPQDKKVAVASAKVTKLQKNISKKEASAEVDSDPKKKSIERWNKLKTTLSGVSKEFGDLGKEMGGTVGDIMSSAADIAGSTFTMIDGITQLVTTSTAATEGVAEGASKSIQSVEKASVILAIIGAAFQIMNKLKGFFSADSEDYEKAKKAYEDYLEVLDRVIDKQKELIGSMTGENAKQSYEYAMSLIKARENASRQLGKDYLNSGASSGFLGIGSSASKGVDQRGGISTEAWNQAKAALGSDFYKHGIGDGRMTGLFDLTLDQLDTLQREAPLFWAQLHDDTKKYLAEILASGEKYEEAKNSFNESQTAITFDELKDSLDDLVKQADLTFGQIQESFEGHMSNAIMNFVKKKNLDIELKKWYDQFANAMASGDKLTKDEADQLKKDYERIVQESNQAYLDAMTAAGLTVDSEETSQESTKAGFESMSQDTADELNGRFTALQMAGEEIKTQNILQTEIMAQAGSQLEALLVAEAEHINIADETREIIVSSYLELQSIRENTGAIVKPINNMSEKLDTIERKIQTL